MIVFLKKHRLGILLCMFLVVAFCIAMYFSEKEYKKCVENGGNSWVCGQIYGGSVAQDLE